MLHSPYDARSLRISPILRAGALSASISSAIRERATSGQLLEDELSHSARVGLAAHLLHHRTDQGTGGCDLAVADLVGDVRVGGDRGVDRSRQRTLVRDDGEPAGGDDLGGRAL